MLPEARAANSEQTISFPAIWKGRVSVPASASGERESRGHRPLARDWAGAKPSRPKAGRICARIAVGNHRGQCGGPTSEGTAHGRNQPFLVLLWSGLTAPACAGGIGFRNHAAKAAPAVSIPIIIIVVTTRWLLVRRDQVERFRRWRGSSNG